MRSLLFKLSGIVILLGSIGGGWLWSDYRAFLERPVNTGGKAVYVTIAPGSSLRDVAETLKRRGLIDSARYLIWAARLNGKTKDIRAGEYEVTPGTTPLRMLDLFVSGHVVQHSLTIIDGWTFRQLRAALAHNEYLKHTINGLDAATIMKRIGAPGVPAEGQFLPDTYYFPRGATDVAFLARAHAAMLHELFKEWQARAPDLPYDNPEQALTMASIIEKETGVPAERARIAGVFVRRLERGMRLETDPSVIYGIGPSFDGDLTRADLHQDTPYNTYMHKGLPPTPIALPGRAAIHAALHPAHGKAMYFVARGDGTHEFSATYAQHLRAVARYQLHQGEAARSRAGDGAAGVKVN